MIITCFNVVSVVSLLTCFPLMIIDRQSLAVKSTFSCSILSITFLIFLWIPFGFSTATVTPMHLPFRYNSTLFVREHIHHHSSQEQQNWYFFDLLWLWDDPHLQLEEFEYLNFCPLKDCHFSNLLTLLTEFKH